MAAEFLVLCGGREGQQTKSYDVPQPHPVCLQKQLQQPEGEKNNKITGRLNQSQTRKIKTKKTKI